MKIIYITWFALFILPIKAVCQNYFQQRVDYNISVKLDDVKNTLTAFEEIVYTNNSPDTLSFLYFHLWPNGYKNLSTPMAQQMQKSGNMHFYYAADSSRGYIDSLNFKVNNEQVNWCFLNDTNDIC
ncbi:MAG: M1 family metallopeptidase, partial [Bacteroidetes bacterium]|nr:M1 family metallopeptidase [Bacteroidota bacterium]